VSEGVCWCVCARLYVSLCVWGGPLAGRHPARAGTAGPHGLDRSDRRDFRPGRSPASRWSGVAKLPWPNCLPAPQGYTVTLVLRVWVSLTSYSPIVQREPVLRGEGPRFVGR